MDVPWVVPVRTVAAPVGPVRLEVLATPSPLPDVRALAAGLLLLVAVPTASERDRVLVAIGRGGPSATAVPRALADVPRGLDVVSTAPSAGRPVRLGTALARLAGPDGRVPVLEAPTPFARAVVTALLAVPPGTTVTYGELAGLAGAPRAARAVGTVMATNPVPLVVPCHRVLPAGARPDRPGAYGWGSAPKARLLAAEAEAVGAPVAGRVAPARGTAA